MGANKEYKNSVFSKLFSNEDVLREVYSAIEGVTLPPDAAIEINTLTDVLYVEKVREYRQNFSLEESLEKAVQYCIGHGVLKQFIWRKSKPGWNQARYSVLPKQAVPG